MARFFQTAWQRARALAPWQILAIVAVFFVPVIGDVLALALFLKWTAFK